MNRSEQTEETPGGIYSIRFMASGALVSSEYLYVQMRNR